MVKRFVFLVRHGERIDKVMKELYSYKGKVNMLDPILTETGVRQARETGEFLKAHLEKLVEKEGRDFEEVIIKTSPFIRCVQTAANIASELDKDIFTVDWGFSEFLGEYLFDEDPIPKLEVQDSGRRKLNETYQLRNVSLHGIVPDDRFYDLSLTPVYPETEVKADDRLKKNL